MPLVDPVTGLHTLLVPVDGSPESLAAVALACGIAKRSKGQVLVAHVIEVPRALQLDAELVVEAASGEQILRRAEEIAETLDFKVQGELLQARDAGHAIVDEATERKADAIVLGVAFRKPYTEVEMGRLTGYVLSNAPCNVVLWRHPIPEEPPEGGTGK